MRTSFGKLRAYWAIAALVSALAVAWWRPSELYPVIAALEGRLLDLRHVVRGEMAPPPDIAIVAIDDKTMSRLQRFPVPRASLAEAIDKLADAGAAVVAVDLLLLEREASSGEGLSAGDQALAAALQRQGRAILAAAASPAAPSSDARAELIHRNAFGPVQQMPDGSRATKEPVGMLLPIDELAAVARLAHVNVVRDRDGAIRRIAIVVPAGLGEYLPAMPLEAVRLLKGIAHGDQTILIPGLTLNLGAREILLSDDNSIALNHYGGQGTFPTYSLIDVIEGQAPSDALRGKAVFIGSTALGNVDVFLSPFSPQLPGVETLATMAGNILEGTYLRRDRSTVVADLALAAILSLLAFFAANMRSLAGAGLATLATWSAMAVALQYGFSAAYLWLDATTAILVLAAVGLATFIARIVQQRRISGQLMRERDNLARYHSPLLTEWLAAQQRPSFNERSQSAAVMFVDVAGFTRRSEHLGPTATVGFLRDLHGRIERAALANRGVIEQFMGDGAMIIFGLPEPADDDAVRCLDAAQQLIADLGDWNLDLKQEGAEPVRLRFGLHFGPVMAALLGGERQGQITVAGDTVNVASRLQEMGKEHAAVIVASAEFEASVRGAGRADLLAGMIRLTGQKVRGRDEVIDLWIWR